MEGQLIVLLLFLGLMYFVLIRPQQRQQKKRTQMLQRLEVGDDIITVGGMHAHVVAIDDDGDNSTVDLLVTEDVVLRFRRSAVAEIVGEPEDAAAADVEDDDAAEST